MAYTHFRFIAYVVPTVAQRLVPNASQPETVYGIPPGTVGNPPNLHGDISKLSMDALTRVQRLVNVLFKAAANQPIMLNTNITDDNILKIFVAPEFYFRPANQEVSYSYAEYQAIKDVLRKTLQQHIATFKHWLIIPGTIMWKWDGTQSTTKRVNTLGKNAFFNSCPYLYINSDTVTSHVLEKAWASGIDGIPTGNHGGTAPIVPNSTSASGTFKHYQGETKQKKHLLKINGLRIGIEICLEHSQLLIKNVVKGKISRSGRRNTTQNFHPHVQAITAGGMSVQSESTFAKTNGFIIRNDGFVPNSQRLAFTMKKITRYDTDQNGNKIANMNDLTQPAGQLSPTIINIRATDSECYLTPPANWTAPQFAPLQKIVIYRRERLP